MIYTLWKARQFERREERKIVDRYHADPVFCQIDLCLKKAYRWKNPYRISRKYWGESTYGETPLTVMEMLGRKLELNPSDLFVDLGSGCGRSVFFMHCFFGCRTLGIERVPLFVGKANEIKKNLYVKGVEFLEGDIGLLSSIYSGSVKNRYFDPKFQFDKRGIAFYVAWTCFSDELLQAAVIFFEQLPKGIKIATVSEPIQSNYCRLIESFTALFAWGEGEIYIHETI